LLKQITDRHADLREAQSPIRCHRLRWPKKTPEREGHQLVFEQNEQLLRFSSLRLLL